MRILYGIQGTGNGHLARARALVPALRKVGLEPDFVFSGRPRLDYFNMELFGDFRCFDGLSLTFEKGKIQFWRTATESKLFRLISDMRQLDLSDYDLVLSDFEPISAWAARRQGIPSVGISHQCAFAYDVPKLPGYPSSRLILKYFAPTDIKLGLHWHHFDQPLLPPLIEPMSAQSLVENKIIVYMGFEELNDVIEFVRPFSNFEFQVYAKVAQPEDYGNIHIRPLSHTEFHRDLLSCYGVISNAGFELASECLVLGKKLLIKPLLGQYEQLCNALAIQTLNRATVMQSLDQKLLKQWLELPCHTPVVYPDVSAILADWINSGCRVPVHQLSQETWNQMDMPLTYDARFGRALVSGLVT